MQQLSHAYGWLCIYCSSGLPSWVLVRAKRAFSPALLSPPSLLLASGTLGQKDLHSSVVRQWTPKASSGPLTSWS